MSENKKTKRGSKRKPEIDREALAYDLFMTGKTGEQIVEWFEMAGVSMNTTTISRWRNAGKWDDKRKLIQLGRQNLSSNIIQNILDVSAKSINEKRPQTPAETDQILKLTKTLELVDSRLTVTTAVDAWEAFFEFVMQKNERGSLEALAAVDPIYKEFILSLNRV